MKSNRTNPGVITWLTSFLLLTTIATKAQFKDFATFSDEERLLKKCSFDSSANAVILLNESLVSHDFALRQINDRRIKIKIFNEKGFSEANMSILVFAKDGYESISDIVGVTINFNIDGTPIMTYLNESSIYQQEAPEGNHYKKIVFPNIQPGCIIDLKYRSIRRHWNYLGTWYFQKELPVYRSRMVIDFPPTSVNTYQVWNSPGFKTITKAKSKTYVEFELKDIPVFIE